MRAERLSPRRVIVTDVVTNRGDVSAGETSVVVRRVIRPGDPRYASAAEEADGTNEARVPKVST